MSTILPTCPDDCTGKAPKFSFTNCNPVTNRGQIQSIYIMAKGGASLTDWSSLVEWTARLALDPLVSIDAIQELYVIGEWPEATSDVKELAHQLKKIFDKTFNINFSIDQVNQDNWDALRQIECDGNYIIWPAGGNYLYGGNDGIDAFITLNNLTPLERKDLETLKGNATWEAPFHPEMETNPML